eukprot:gene2833-3276_t
MAAYRQCSETATQLFARLGKQHIFERLDIPIFKVTKQGTLSPGDVIEIYGEEGSGKTTLLMHVCIKCILPKLWQGLELNGLESKVIYIDTDYKFPLRQFRVALESHLKKALENANQVEENLKTCGLNDFLESCLERLFICRCHSSYNLAKTLGFMETLLQANPDVSMIMVDSISSFHWTDRTIGGYGRAEQEANQRDMLTKLRKLIDVYHIVVLATKSAIMNPKFHNVSSSNTMQVKKNKSLSWQHDMYMSQTWNNFIKYRYLIHKIDDPLERENCTVYSAYLLEDPNLREYRFTITKFGIEFL